MSVPDMPPVNVPAMHVPLLDLKPQYQALKAELDAVVLEVCASQGFILGPHVKALELEVAAYSGCTHGIGMSSGTDALLAALMALDIGPGDAVLTTPYTFFATAGTIARVGARPVFVDIDPSTYNLSVPALEDWLRQHGRQGPEDTTVRAIMPVHLYGQMVPMDGVMALAREFDLAVIEDAAQAIGSADAKGRRACSIGDVGCLSFFPTKNLGAFGDAGMCVTNTPALAQKLAMIRVHGMEPKYFHALIGGNFRLDELQAAVLRIKLKHLDAWTRARQENACFYFDAFERAKLKSIVTLPGALPGRHIYNQFIIRASDRDGLKAHLAAAGVGSEIYYPLPLHRQECFAYLGYGEGAFPEAERAARETLALPIFPELKQHQLQYVVDQIAAFYGKS